MPRAEITVTGVSTAVPMPSAAERSSGGRGNKSRYDLSVLKVGQSIGVIGTTKKNLSTTISTAKKRDWPVLDSKGNPVMEPIKDGNGTVIGSQPKVEKRVFFAIDCDPAKDPDKATARIFREK